MTTDAAMVAELEATLRNVQARQRELDRVHSQLTAAPWFPAVILDANRTSRGLEVLVHTGSGVRVVPVLDAVADEPLLPGDEVLLGSGQNVVVARSASRVLTTGETAQLERELPDGRVVVRARDEEIVVRAAAALSTGDLRQGDQVRWNRALGMALERLPRAAGEHLFLEDTPQERFADIGGLDRDIARLQRTIRLHLEHPAAVQRYRLRRKASVLLAGPPGTGKTMIARALANWLGELSAAGRSRFMNVKPAGLHSMWFAQSEANYREAFRAAREAGAREPDVPVVMFFDEVDAVGGVRGQGLHRVDDRVLTAFMTELDGLESRGNVLVVAATNRRDAIDPALLRPGRLGDLVLEIGRPGPEAAREIFARHLPGNIPWDPAGSRDEQIAAAVSRLYAPNGLGDLAVLTLRDGKRRTVAARHFVSGARIAAICQAAIEQACEREQRDGPGGVRAADLLGAVDHEFVTAAAVLAPRNCAVHLEDLPQDVDVVRVEPVVRRARAEYRYLRPA